MKLTVRKTIFAAAVCAVLLLVSGCGKKEDTAAKSAAAADEEKTVYAVNTYVTSAENLDAYLEFGGDVAASSSVDVLPDTSGKLTGIRVKTGDYVKKNQLLAEVDPSRPGMTYETSPVRAPVSGTVTSFPLSAGTMVAPSLSIGKISSTNDLEISISVAERFVSRIKTGQKAVLTFDAYPGETFSAKVTEVSPVLDTYTRSMNVTLRLDPPDNRIKIGMYTRVKLITDTKSGVVAVPRTAILTRSEKEYVFVVDPESKTVTARTVTSGITVDDKIEITSGLTAGDEVVMSGQTLLDDGSQVNVVSRTGGK
ncbi:efflux RND transporter periplasmic adaptor subunit [Treponema brennaborense]|uniref:Efflux transporter, RND family, MFP subunit n=1 Tax=Treponema brennaborense (strain DSM 12168 / CIP 105900 / DD5/3) TaxID=906968 RepID=F4LLX5_TREBD|nr:efflux RND transporter periplasmic adaptor subunit [Treponema brennaborense]AEE15667.1 efflux transporter, RND family, MFP subunit [Treponema brennaborense DSM 12168]